VQASGFATLSADLQGVGPTSLRLARLFESMPPTCPNFGADIRIIAFITDAAPVERILLALGEPPRPPPIAPKRPGAAHSCSAWVPAQTILVWSFAAQSQLTHPHGQWHSHIFRNSIFLKRA